MATWTALKTESLVSFWETFSFNGLSVLFLLSSLALLYRLPAELTPWYPARQTQGLMTRQLSRTLGCWVPQSGEAPTPKVEAHYGRVGKPGAENVKARNLTPCRFNIFGEGKPSLTGHRLVCPSGTVGSGRTISRWYRCSLLRPSAHKQITLAWGLCLSNKNSITYYEGRS